MLATFVIGLREGLEAALIVGIIAAFLRQSGRADALRRMWVGVAVAVLLCLGVGVVLQAVNSALPQRQQEMLECVVAAVAVCMVSYMVLWMRAHSRSLKADLHRAAGGALASGSATALVLMAFLAVFREGFETAVFLLAAFQSAVSPIQAAAGALLGILLAVGLGYLIYRGGVRLNLAKFFRLTGVVLVLVAAGLVMSTLRAAYEAGWLTVGQQHAVSLSLLARPGTVQESLLTGVLGIRSTMPVIEVVAYLLYLVPMLAVVLWPAGRMLSATRRRRVLAGTAVGALVAAAALAIAAPPAPSADARAVDLQLAVGTVPTDPIAGTVALTGGVGSVAVTSTGAGTVRFAGNAPAAPTSTASTSTASTSGTATSWTSLSGTSTLTLTGHSSVAGIQAAVYTGTAIGGPVDAEGQHLPGALTVAQMAALGSGRLPLGLSATGHASRRAAYADSWTPTVTIDPATGTVVDVVLRGSRSVSVVGDGGQVFALGAIADLTASVTPAAVAAQAAAASALLGRRADAQVLGQVLPGMLTVFAVVLLGFALPRRRRSAGAAVSGVPAPVAADAAGGRHEELLAAPQLR